ncbi:hypothetical protein Pmar_PMAR000189, partial [Perkinsus marinus ATCC 50983]
YVKGCQGGPASPIARVEFLAGSPRERNVWVAALSDAVAELRGEQYASFVSARMHHEVLERFRRDSEGDVREKSLQLVNAVEAGVRRRWAFFTWRQLVKGTVQVSKLKASDQFGRVLKSAVAARQARAFRILSCHAQMARVEQRTLSN